MELNKREFMLLYYVCRTHVAYRSLLRFKGTGLILDSLEENGFVEVIYEDDQISGIIETKKGIEVLNSPRYEEWLLELEG